MILLEDSYRTRSTYGPSRTDLTPLNFFNILFETILFLNEALFAQWKRTRSIIYFFANAFSQASYSNYMSALFEKHFSHRLTTADLRKTVMPHSLSLPQSSDYSL